MGDQTLEEVVDQEISQALGETPLLERKEAEHGSFAKNAEISGEIFNILAEAAEDSEADQYLSPEAGTALFMLCLKLARCVSHKDGFVVNDCDGTRDIVGYAQLLDRAVRREAQEIGSA